LASTSKVINAALDLNTASNGLYSVKQSGFKSLNGKVTCIECVNDKCIDVEIKTKECKSCNFWEKKKIKVVTNIKLGRKQQMFNHHDNSVSIETSGTLSICKRSVES